MKKHQSFPHCLFIATLLFGLASLAGANAQAPGALDTFIGQLEPGSCWNGAGYASLTRPLQGNNTSIPMTLPAALQTHFETPDKVPAGESSVFVFPTKNATYNGLQVGALLATRGHENGIFEDAIVFKAPLAAVRKKFRNAIATARRAEQQSKRRGEPEVSLSVTSLAPLIANGRMIGKTVLVCNGSV